MTKNKEEKPLTRADVEKIVQASVQKYIKGIEENVQFVIEELPKIDASINDAMVAFNTNTQTMNKFAEVITGHIKDLTQLSTKLAEAVTAVASRGGGRRQVQTKPISEFNMDGLASYLREKLDVQRNGDKVVIRQKQGQFLGNDREDSKKKWIIVTRYLETFGIKWVKEPNNYRWEN